MGHACRPATQSVSSADGWHHQRYGLAGSVHYIVEALGIIVKALKSYHERCHPLKGLLLDEWCEESDSDQLTVIPTIIMALCVDLTNRSYSSLPLHELKILE